MKIGITTGDPNGIGIEVIAKALKRLSLTPEQLILFGPHELLTATGLGGYQIIDPADFKAKDQKFGQVCAKAGQSSFQYIVTAIEAALAGEIDSLVTAPINKEALKFAAINFPGHTEILKHYTKSQRAEMMFSADNLRMILSTIHIPLATVPQSLTIEKLNATVETGLEGTKLFGIKNPKIAVAGLNPHAGENGLFGREEIEVITPVIDKFRKIGIDIDGPYPADTLFTQKVRNAYDLLITHYHDQGLTAFKALYFDQAVNITLGLPFIRTSVDHGTAFNIAGQGLANESSMIAAIKTAQLLTKNRQTLTTTSSNISMNRRGSNVFE